MKLYNTIEKLNKFLEKNDKGIVLNDSGQIKGFSNNLMPHQKRNKRRR